MTQRRGYLHVARAVYDRPWALHPATLATMGEIVRMRIAGDRFSDAEIQARIEAAASKNGERIGAQRVGTVSVIPVYGVISQRSSLFSDFSGGTSLELLTAALRDELADDDVSAVVLDIDSPGGSIDGLPEAAAQIRAMRDGGKPIVTVANTMIASAAAWIGLQASEVVVVPSGSIGSVGVYCLHWDYSAQLEMDGERPTFIYAGEHKVDGNPYQPLGEDAKATVQTEVNYWYRAFKADLAKARNKTVAQVESDFGQGNMLLPEDAVRAGMADRIDTLDNVIRKLSRGRGTVKRPGALESGPAIATFRVGDIDLASGSVAIVEDDPDAAAIDRWGTSFADHFELEADAVTDDAADDGGPAAAAEAGEAEAEPEPIAAHRPRDPAREAAAARQFDQRVRGAAAQATNGRSFR